MEMSTAKTIAVFAIIVGCFAVLYPKIFHPMLLHAIGAAPSRSPESMTPQIPPHLRRPGPGRGAPHGDDFAQHMRGGPHPGMRAAAEMKKQAATTTGSGKGMMSVVLPMYAVGIVIYLIYTMTKVFGGKGKNEKEDKDYMSSHFKDGNKRRLLVEDDDPRVKQQAGSPQDNRKRQKDLERLLMKADKDKIYTDPSLSFSKASAAKESFGLGTIFGSNHRNKSKISEVEMHQLKQRLLETEAQMTRILQAMETVAEKVEEQQEQPSAEAAAEGAKDRPTKLQTDMSPDLESYDFVQRSSAEQSPVMVEDIQAQEHDLKDNGEQDLPEAEDEDGALGNSEDDDDDDDEDVDEVELEYDPSPAEEEEEEAVGSEDVIIGQNNEEVQKEEERPDLRKRRMPSNQKHKVKRAD